MSTDYNLKCVDCGEHLKTVASRSISYGDKLWAGPDEFLALREFLFKHERHRLVFGESVVLEDEDIRDFIK